MWLIMHDLKNHVAPTWNISAMKHRQYVPEVIGIETNPAKATPGFSMWVFLTTIVPYVRSE